jgi:hypothetical protein
MKPSAQRSALRDQGKTILRAISRKNYWCIAEYNGFGWSNWHETDFFKNREKAEKTIEMICARDPQRFINDNSLSSAGTQLNAEGERAHTAIS